MINQYRYTTYARRPDLLGEARKLNGSVWPEFMYHDAVADRLWDRLEGTFADYQTMCQAPSTRSQLMSKPIGAGTSN